MGANVELVTDLGNDVLEVRGTVDDNTGEDGQPVQLVAFGWVSAMENHYPDAKHDDDGNRDPAAKPTPMTDDERMAYWGQLLTNMVPTAVHPAEAVLYEAPEAATIESTPTEAPSP